MSNNQPTENGGGQQQQQQSLQQPVDSMSNNNNNKNTGTGGAFQILMDPNQPKILSTKYSYEKAMHRDVPIVQSKNEYSVEQITRTKLPYYLPWSLQSNTGQKIDLPTDYGWVATACGTRVVIGVVGGGGMGLLMGVFLGAMSDSTPPVQVIAGKDVPQAPLKEQLRVVSRATFQKSLYWCRNFAFLSGIFGGTECIVEKYRAKHDVWNAVASGCVTGAALQAKAGPQAAAIGCGGFAAFSLVIDTVMGTHS